MAWYDPSTWGEKTAENIFDKDNGIAVKLGAFINDLHYSDAEKAENNETLKEFALRRLEVLKPFKVVQRIIAGCTLFGWLFVLINLAIAIWVEAITKTVTIVDGVEVITSIDAKSSFWALAQSDFVFWPVVCVFSLYCGGGVLRYFRRDRAPSDELKDRK